MELEKKVNVEESRRLNRKARHGGSDALRHLSQPADAPPPDLFKPWTKLQTVVLFHNQLLHVDQLFFGTNPVIILLRHNNLTDLDSVLHPGMYNLSHLDLSYNPFTRVTENSFIGKVNNTNIILLNNCLIQEFNARHYTGLQLIRLDLSYNLIDKAINIFDANYTDIAIPTSHDSFFQSSLLLDLGSRTLTKTSPVCPYSSVMQFNISSSLLNRSRYLDCLENTNTNIRYVTFSDISHIYSLMMNLSMTGNRIEILRSADFIQLIGMRLLSLRNNDIRQVDGKTFILIRNTLMHLDLSQNKIHSFTGLRTLPVRSHITQSRR
ncbi:protein toll [Caerostris extrusa]|uniref:Protein toll n=1 Tax=Caerostris extrusa TaxID=172846 RepID=A0AAV4PUH9_CAEEX|nr:protein toll [Caerostris extrusa]